MRIPFGQLDDSQIEAIQILRGAAVSILTGPPGSGKTTTIRTLVEGCLGAGGRVALAAPTGRAARKMSQASGASAQTLHRLLAWQEREHRFTRDATNPLDAQVLIVDEVSMLDQSLALALFRAVPETSQVILVGDEHQLPSVAPGAVLRDLSSSGVIPVARLATVHRYGGQSPIAKIAGAILAGHADDALALLRSAGWFIEAPTTKAILKTLSDLPPAAGPVLTSENKRGAKVKKINNVLQHARNRYAQTLAPQLSTNSKLKLGDPVLQNQNNYALEIYNGETGVVRGAGDDGKYLIIDFCGQTVQYPIDKLRDVSLGYGMTIHKSQGSEWPSVVVVVDPKHGALTMQQLYTALTRSRSRVIVVGDPKAFRAAVSRDGAHRHTRLAERLRAALPAPPL